MRIAIQDSWPNLPESAEREFIERFKIACHAVGVDCESVVTSDDLIAFGADIVLVSHEFSRKVTNVPTVGLLWSPLSFFQDDPYRVQSILSYDGYLPGNPSIATYLRDLQAGITARKPIGRDVFLPTSYTTDIHALEKDGDPSLSYIGVHWDGARHRDLFDTLSKRRLITCYGPEQSWRHLPDSYGGYLPFDGRSVIQTIGKHGMALCLHKVEHRLENTPSMRIFEALSVGALPICDDIQFARDNLADFASFVDMSQPPQRVADDIAAALDQVRNQPDAARERARKAKAWFDANWSLEAKIKNLIIPFAEELKHVGRFVRDRQDGGGAVAVKGLAGLFGRKPVKPAATPQCEVVMRSGGRDLDYVRRAIGSVKAANSSVFPIGMVVVDYKGREDLKALCGESAEEDFPIRYIRSPGTGFRSTALWDGLKAVRAPFVAHIDDDDSVFENHYRQLATAFEGPGDINVAYTGVIRIEDEPGNYIAAPNYDGPIGKIIEELRELKFLDLFDLERLAKFDNYIQSNAWMARTSFVQSLLGEDPQLVVVEDVYLYLLMAAHGPFAFTGSPTAMWHWRSSSNENSMMAVDQNIWAKAIERVKLRLATIPFRQTTTFHRLLNPAVGVDVGLPQKRPESLPPLNFNHAIEGGLAFKSSTIIDGFHEPEIGGIWSKETEATILIPLGTKVRDEGGVLAIECLGSMADVEDRWINIELIGGAGQDIAVTDWSMYTVHLPLPAKSASPIILKITSSHLIGPGNDSKERRELGAFIQSVRVLAADETDSIEPVVAIAPASALLGPLGVPFIGGIARGVLETRKRVPIWIRTSTPGRLYLGDSNGALSIADATDGEFHIPGRLAASSRWFVFQPIDPNIDGEVRVEQIDGQGTTEWTTFNADAQALLRDYRSADGSTYQHAAATLTGSKLIDRGPQPLYLLIQKDGEQGWWEIRPSYGPAWDALFDQGAEAEDDAGPYRRGSLAGAAAGSEDETFVVTVIMRSILIGAIKMLAEADHAAPIPFLLWLGQELLPPRTTNLLEGPQRP